MSLIIGMLISFSVLSQVLLVPLNLMRSSPCATLQGCSDPGLDDYGKISQEIFHNSWQIWYRFDWIIPIWNTKCVKYEEKWSSREKPVDGFENVEKAPWAKKFIIQKKTGIEHDDQEFGTIWQRWKQWSMGSSFCCCVIMEKYLNTPDLYFWLGR